MTVMEYAINTKPQNLGLEVDTNKVKDGVIPVTNFSIGKDYGVHVVAIDSDYLDET